MVIDFHTHCFADSIAKRAVNSLYEACGRIYEPCADGTVKGLVDNMDKFGVDISVVQPVLTKPSQLKTVNEWAAGIQSDRIISFGGFHPATDDYKRDIDFICSLGLKGIKMHCEYQQFYVDAPEMLKIYDYAFSKGLIIIHHAGFDPAFPPPFHSSPEQFANIAGEMKGGVLVAAHLGGQKQWDEVYKHLAGTDVYLDTSMGFKYYSNEQFMKIVEKHGAEKIMFGSDSPWSKASEELGVLKSLDLTAEQKELILHKTAERLLGL
ncbi:MAG: amidohydrolase [Ruminococcaceae bacterium]|nr:amidohydrolase [Oscillospiraceae bacterium]